MPAALTEPNMVFLLGDPVEHSLSPRFQNAAFRALEIPWTYAARQVDTASLTAALDALAVLGLVGANITVPHKVAAMGSMDALDREASIVGAVNTVSVTPGGLKGSNTDVDGFSRSLREVLPEGLARPAAVILGAGGAARAVAWALVRDGWTDRITVVNRTMERGQVLINTIRDGEARKGGGGTRFDLFQDPADLPAELRAATGLLVNATPVGQGEVEGETPIEDLTGFEPGALVFDLVYAKESTTLVRTALEAGLDATDGMGMLLHQGARSFELWTGETAPLDVMRSALGPAGRL